MDESHDDLRAADHDRDRIVAKLQRALGEGRIDLDEFDDRTRRVWQAKTYGDLAAITADLPAAVPSAPAPTGRSSGPVPPARHRIPGIAPWLAVVTLTLVIWAAVSLAHHEALYPWWLWVAGPWGFALVAKRFGYRSSCHPHRGR
ncbi:MAG TPA: DUF1707 domain-containing protein [Amycolatopsis sp.]|nr:DUF1707 domain-containing protein [Amycolatopsis sp.]